MNAIGTYRAIRFRSYSHLGEIVQGPIRNDDGKAETVVVTLPCRAYHSDAIFVQDDAYDDVVVDDPKRNTCKEFMRRFKKQYGLGGRRNHGRVFIRSNIPVGAGAGSSTCDLHALCLCFERLAKIRLSREKRQRLIFETEGASDPLALVDDESTPVYCSRTGRILQILPRGLPPMKSISFRTDVRVVKTNDLIGREGYDEREVELFSEILNDAKRAVTNGNLTLLADAAQRSATLNQRRVPTRNYSKLISVTKRFGAGFTVSHSGVVGSMFFSPSVSALTLREATKAMTYECGYFDFRHF